MTLLVVFFLVSITFSFLCSLWEASLLTIPPSYVEARNQEGSAVGAILKGFKDNVDRPLSAILTLNTIAHTVGAIGVGAQATRVWPGDEFVTGIVVPTVMTLAILILSEIIPKTIGATYWRKLAPFTARTLNFSIKVLLPLVWLSQQITKLLKGKGHQTTMSREDITALATLSEREGVLQRSESVVMQNLLRSREILVSDIMTPRTVMLAAPSAQTIDEFLGANPELRFSRIPVYATSIDEISSFVLKDTLLIEAYRGHGDRPLAEFARPIMSVDVGTAIPTVFDQMVEKREHIALVLGPYGGTAGLVSQEDVIETLFGLEIVDESDETTDMQLLARTFRDKRRARNGLHELPVEEAKAVLNREQPLLGLTGQSPTQEVPGGS